MTRSKGLFSEPWQVHPDIDTPINDGKLDKASIERLRAAERALVRQYDKSTKDKETRLREELERSYWSYMDDNSDKDHDWDMEPSEKTKEEE